MSDGFQMLAPVCRHFSSFGMPDRLSDAIFGIPDSQKIFFPSSQLVESSGMPDSLPDALSVML